MGLFCEQNIGEKCWIIDATGYQYRFPVGHFSQNVHFLALAALQNPLSDRKIVYSIVFANHFARFDVDERARLGRYVLRYEILE